MRHVSEVMTSQVVTVTPSTPFKEAVEALASNRVTAAPVVDEDGWVVGVVSEADLLLKEEYRRDHQPGMAERRGRLVGIVSRGDLLRGFLRSDQQILEEIREDVLGRRLMADPGRFVVHVDDGVVTLEGRCERHSLAPILVQLIYAVDGVVHVDPRLSWDVDDSPPRHTVAGQLGP